MRTGFKIAMGIAAAIVLVIGGFGVGWLVWGRLLWAPGMMGGPVMWGNEQCANWGGASWRMGPGMMGRWQGPGMMYGGSGWNASEDCPMAQGYAPSTTGTIDMAEAQAAVEGYVRDLGYADLEIAELMEFEQNYYAIVREEGTGIGAMELLVDKVTGAVGPEMGPNMMWNAKYGMHHRSAMMGRTRATNTLSEAQALEAAQRWLDANRSGVTTEEHADPFYGYYTIHTVQDGRIEGMLSVHGTTGQVWYHNWHGAFLQMVEDDDHG
jgi:hypothetical protein